MGTPNAIREKEKVLDNMRKVLLEINNYVTERCLIKDERVWACSIRLNVSEYIARNFIQKNLLRFSSVHKILVGAKELNNDFLTFILNSVKNIFIPDYPYSFMICECNEELQAQIKHPSAGKVLKDLLVKSNTPPQLDIDALSGFSRTTLQNCIANRKSNNFLTNVALFWECYKLIPNVSKEVVLEFMCLSCRELMATNTQNNDTMLCVTHCNPFPPIRTHP